MRGATCADDGRRRLAKVLRGSKSWKEVRELLRRPMIGAGGIGREGAIFTTRPCAAMTMRRRTADSAGLRAGDIVVEFDGKTVSDLQSYSDALYARSPGDEVDVVVLRGSERLRLRVRLGRRGS